MLPFNLIEIRLVGLGTANGKSFGRRFEPRPPSPAQGLAGKTHEWKLGRNPEMQYAIIG
jgi:hypothetical protein